MTLELYTVDSFLEPRLHQKAYNYAMNRGQARWGEVDMNPDLPTGLTVNMNDSEEIYKKFDVLCREKFPIVKDFEVVRMYINCYMPYEQPQFHQDTIDAPGLKSYTGLYYPQLEWDKNEGGCTEFVDDDHVYGSLPLPNRALMFNGIHWHRATPFRNHVRFTYAVKYEKIDKDVFDFNADFERSQESDAHKDYVNGSWLQFGQPIHSAQHY